MFRINWHVHMLIEQVEVQLEPGSEIVRLVLPDRTQRLAGDAVNPQPELHALAGRWFNHAEQIAIPRLTILKPEPGSVLQRIPGRATCSPGSGSTRLLILRQARAAGLGGIWSCRKVIQNLREVLGDATGVLTISPASTVATSPPTDGPESPTNSLDRTPS
jgi:hypothetical protein